MTNKWRKYIFWFAQEHVDFRYSEIDSVTKLFGIEWRKLEESTIEQPFWLVELPNQDAAKSIASRSISLRCILELWSHSNTIGKMHEGVRKYMKDENLEEVFSEEKTFKIIVETYNKHFSQKEKLLKIEQFDYLDLDGRVDLRTPSIQWWYIEYYGLDPKIVPTEPNDVLFGRWIADGQRNLIKDLSLKRRKFIGNTSMDAQLSVLMANQAQVKKGDLVYDPFVGTGSLLVSAAKFGGYVLGSDIDWMMLHAKSRPSRITQKIREIDESVRANLEQYECGQYYIDVLVSDFSNPIWRDQIQFDSIITDPPYGIRESTERIEMKTSSKINTKKEDSPHYPSTTHYSLQNLYTDLLEFSAKHLRLNGRLVCWLPIHKDDYSEDFIPKHNNLKLIGNSEQTLSSFTSRRLLTYEKISEENSIENNIQISFTDFRQRYFEDREETRQERRIRRAELREIGRQEAVKRGKKLDENGKVINR